MYNTYIGLSVWQSIVVMDAGGGGGGGEGNVKWSRSL